MNQHSRRDDSGSDMSGSDNDETEPDPQEPASRQRNVWGATAKEFVAYGVHIQQREPTAQKVKDAAAVAAPPNAEDVKAKARKVIEDAEQRQDRRLALGSRVLYSQLSSDKYLLEPTLPDTFLNKVRLTALRSLVDVEAELQARGITGWVPRSEGGSEPFRELRDRLPTFTEGEGEGAVVFLVGGRMGDILDADTSAADRLLVDPEDPDGEGVRGMCNVM